MVSISDEKSKITNLRRHYSEFLGYKLKVTKKIKIKSNNQKQIMYTLESHVCDKALESMKAKLAKRIKDLQEDQSHYRVALLNSSILGMHNYYKYATHVSSDFKILDFHLRKTIYNRLRKHIKRTKIVDKNSTAYKYYKNYKGKLYSMSGIIVYPICCVTNKHPLGFTQSKCDYTKEGRALIHKNLDGFIYDRILYMLRNPIRNKSIEYNDNRISKYSSQMGECAINGEFMEIDNMHCHHQKPVSMGGTDKFQNLVCITNDSHILIHATKSETIEKYLDKIKPSKDVLEKINQFRVKVGNGVIELSK